MAKNEHLWSVGRIAVVLGLVAAISLGMSGGSWWRKNYNDPQHVFWGMLSLNLKTGSVTRRVVQAADDGSLDQITTVSLGSQNTAHALTILTQPGAAGNDTVITESIGTRDADYVRYQRIDTSQRSASGAPINFSNVLGVWGKSDTSNGQAAQLFNQSIIGVVPFANLSDAGRSRVLAVMRDKNTYMPDYNSVKRQKLNGRLVYTYKVNVDPAAYITMLKALARELGLSQLDAINADDYAGRPAQQLEFSIDVLSRQLRTIRYSDSGREEKYSGFGLQTIAQTPAKPIPVSELQNRLQQLQ